MPYTVTVSHEIKDNKLEVCQAIIKHDFQESNLPLLREALTVPFGKTIENNRILAQTGDAALILILRKYGVEYKRNVDPELTVFKIHDEAEGCKTDEFLAQRCTETGLVHCIYSIVSVVLPGRKAQADTVEAILGAVFEDAGGYNGGLNAVEAVMKMLGLIPPKYLEAKITEAPLLVPGVVATEETRPVFSVT